MPTLPAANLSSGYFTVRGNVFGEAIVTASNLSIGEREDPEGVEEEEGSIFTYL